MVLRQAHFALVERTLLRERLERFSQQIDILRLQIGKVVVGQEEMVEQVLLGLLGGGHILLEGVPGLGKTLLVRTLGDCLGLQFSRIQFTPDLMPADVIGTQILETTREGERGFRFQAGPIFTHLLLADEINRATPKTQSALLEAMQEGQITVAGVSRPLPRPFFVLATQNPLEMEGTYPLPEAQVDRFLFKIIVRYPTAQELSVILDRTTGSMVCQAEQVCDQDGLLEMQRMTREVILSDSVRDYVAQLIVATQPASPTAPDVVRRFVRYGSSPRGAQALILAAKARALLGQRFNVSFEDVRTVAEPSLRHRLIPSFEAQAEGVAMEQVLTQLLEAVRPEVPE